MSSSSRYAAAFEKCREFSAADVARREGLPLKRQGGKYWACCPFHKEKTASCSFDDNGLFYCFGCHVGGDAVTFYSMLHGIGKGAAALELSGLRGIPQHLKRKAAPPSAVPFLGLPDEDGFTWDRLCRIRHAAQQEIEETEAAALSDRESLAVPPSANSLATRDTAEKRFWEALAAMVEADFRLDAIWETQSGMM